MGGDAKMTKADHFIARVQATCAIIALIGVIETVQLLVFFGEKVSTVGTALLATMATGLLALAAQSFAYLYARQRPPTQGVPDEPPPAPPVPSFPDPARLPRS